MMKNVSWFWTRFGRGSSSNFSTVSIASSSSNDSVDSSIQNQNYRYDVFISFRGPDTRNTFVDHLYAHLLRKGIFVFKDDEKLQKGESISAQLLQAIQDSRLSIIVFSKQYASSTWCLDEMAAIADCKQQSNQTVFPVFYDVDPSHVRHQNGAYEVAFVSHRSRFREDPDKVDRWARAMTDLANSAGWDVMNKPEFREIENIVQEVIKTLGHKFSGFVDDLIGIQSRVQELEGSLKLSSNNDNVRVLGICGMGGIGKTTQAVVLYDRISYKFDACCFVENVNKIYRDGGATAIQKQIVRQTLDEKNLEIYSPFEISGIVRNRLHNIKVLIFLDNVDQIEQLQELAINPNFLFEGSRMIIITRDEHILKVYGAHVIHKVSLMNDNDARKLFYSKAFKSEDQSSSCVELIPEVLKYVQCLPLAIKVIGSFLCTRNATQWKDALDRFQNSPDNGIMDVLQISIDGLQYEEKEIFLHIACFFKEEMEDYAKRILNCCGLHTHIGIPRLIEKSLITLRDQEIHMHDMLQELGKKIVRNQFPEQPGSWSRIWLYEDFFRVMTTQTGTNNVTAVVLNKKDQDMSECSVAELSKMKNLRLLILYHKSFSGSLDFLSTQLRYLLWHDYPFTSLPSCFAAFDLEELNMPSSSINCLWEGRKEPCNFRCGFDIVVPLGLEVILPRWLLNQGFKGDSVIRIMQFNVDDNWIGFVFCVTFERNIIRPAVSSSSPHCSFSSSHPFRLSFESEYTEEYFDMPLNLELNKIYGSKHLWVIYISREHCHFVKTGAHITFKAHSSVKINAWGMKSIFRQDIDDLERMQQGESLPLHPNDVVHHVDFDSVEKSNNNSGPKFQLPYNWLVTKEDEVENMNTKAKETNLSNAGL